MPFQRILIALVTALAVPALACAAPLPADLDTGLIPKPTLLMPDGPAIATVFLLSDAGGWGEAEAESAARLRGAGAAVVGIDLPAYIASLEAADKDCVYLVADFERMSHAIERATGAATFHAPLVAGSGTGGALALDILSQTPPDTLGGVVVAHPAGGQPLAKPLCTAANRSQSLDGVAYTLAPGAPPAPLTLILGPSATAAARTRADGLTAAGVTFSRRMTSSPGLVALGDAVAADVASAAMAGDAPEIVELPAAPAHDAMAIMLSGDGGWRDIDRTVAGLLQQQGVPTVGIDSLRWFWSARTPEETGRELARLIDIYADRWHVDRVILAGYSFGASVLPAAYLAMPQDAQDRVAEIALLAPGAAADWEITVSGWLGATSNDASDTAGPLASLPAAKVLCVSGRKETDSGCPALTGTAARLVSTDGGHHFDGDYAALAQLILAGITPASATDAAE